jgi:hypothetical protein
LELEAQKKKIQEATGSGEFPDRVFAYLSVASTVNEGEAWTDTVSTLLKCFREFAPNQDLPLIKDATGEKGKPSSWDYEGRGFWLWANVLCKAYGWTIEYVSDMDYNDAFTLLQEILTDEQLDKEFTYSLSEIAYPYNKSTKKNHFKPLPRPYWMKAVVSEIKKVKFHKEFLPQGMVIDTSGMPLEYNPLRDTAIVQNKKKTEETNSPPSP